jgi:hypothetical protein
MSELEDDVKIGHFSAAYYAYVNGQRKKMVEEIKNFPAFFDVVDYLEWVEQDYGPTHAFNISLFIHSIIGVKS